MDLWLDVEVRMRRNDAHAYAQRKRQARLCESTRSTGIRATAADLIQLLSDALAAAAAALRGSKIVDG